MKITIKAPSAAHEVVYDHNPFLTGQSLEVKSTVISFLAQSNVPAIQSIQPVIEEPQEENAVALPLASSSSGHMLERMGALHEQQVAQSVSFSHNNFVRVLQTQLTSCFRTYFDNPSKISVALTFLDKAVLEDEEMAIEFIMALSKTNKVEVARSFENMDPFRRETAIEFSFAQDTDLQNSLAFSEMMPLLTRALQGFFARKAEEQAALNFMVTICVPPGVNTETMALQAINQLPQGLVRFFYPNKPAQTSSVTSGNALAQRYQSMASSSSVAREPSPEEESIFSIAARSIRERRDDRKRQKSSNITPDQENGEQAFKRYEPS